MFKTIHQHHLTWDNSLAPAAVVEPGETIHFEILEASGGKITAASIVEDVLTLSAETANPLTGPIYIEGAEPGDSLKVEIVDFELSSWGWSALIPEFGLLSDDFPDPYLVISKYNEKRIELLPGIEIPTNPFPGTIGVAPKAPGALAVIPPHQCGGNMDIPGLGKGSCVYFPVQVPGALFSIGDTHAAQGEGEVCGTAIESPMRVHLRFEVVKDFALESPWAELPEASHARIVGKRYLTTGIDKTLFSACRSATRRMIELLMKKQKMSAEDAYILCSVAMNLRIAEVVNAPNWVVTAQLSTTVFR